MEGKKDLSISTEIVDVSNPSKVYVPLINCGVLCTATAKKGKKVLPLLSPLNRRMKFFLFYIRLYQKKLRYL